MIQELELSKKQIITQNKVLTSKLNTIIASTQKFLKETSGFQKSQREKEGFNSLNMYENEKHKLEMKIKEMGEKKENSPLGSPVQSPARKQHIDYQFSEKTSSYEAENKILKNQLRDYKKNVKTLEIKCAELENFRWHSEKEKQFLDRKTKNSTPKQSFNYQKALETAKHWAECKISEAIQELEQKYALIQSKLSEKEASFNELRNRFTENLKENLNILIAMNEDLKSTNSDKSNESVRVQLENLEYIIEQNRTYSEIKIQELNETIELLENERNSFMKANQQLEKENFQLKFEANKLKDIENSFKASKLMISELEESNRICNSRIRQLKQKELEIDHILYEKSAMKVEIEKLVEEIGLKDKFIIELQQTLKTEERQANYYLEDLVFKEKAAKCEIETLKKELDDCRFEKNKLEKVQSTQVEQIKVLEQNIKLLRGSESLL